MPRDGRLNIAFPRQPAQHKPDNENLRALHPEEAVPLLEHKLLAEGANLKWVHYALGRCATPHAVALLKKAARREKNWDRRRRSRGTR